MISIVNRPVRVLACATLGLALRILVTANFKESLGQRVEIKTSISDWKRAQDAIYLWNSGLDPYTGNMFHEYPISLQFYKIMSNFIGADLAFPITDTLTAFLLSQSVFNHLMPVKNDSWASISLLIYLFSPINIIACAGQSTSTFTNFLIALISFILPQKPFRILTCVMCAFLACNNIHYSTLVLPVFLCMEYCSKKATSNQQNKTSPSTTITRATTHPYYENRNFYSSLATSICIYLASVSSLLVTSYLLMGNSYAFLDATYLFVLNIRDLTPNIGMFWYFFTEMFEHFEAFFTWLVQINAFVHVIPLSVCFRNEPTFALYMTLVTSTIFQPYPSLSNIAMITSLLPYFAELIMHMKQGLYVCCTAITCMSLWPIFWHLWIVMGTANSNFYFGATLAFTVSLVIFMVDLFNSHFYLKRKARLDEIKKEQNDAEQKNK